MWLEIEAKICIHDPVAIGDRLTQLAGSPSSVIFEVNIFLDTPASELQAADSGLRIRINTDESRGQSTYVVTFKGARQPGPFKRREEFEVAVDDPEQAVKLFRNLGFVEHLSFEKRRATWVLDGCEVVIDELPELGHFLEIEGPTEAVIQGVRMKLGLGEDALVREGYAEIVSGHLAGRSTRLTFSGSV